MKHPLLALYKEAFEKTVNRLLAIDPGTGHSGWAILDRLDDGTYIVVTCGYINGDRLLIEYVQGMGKYFNKVFTKLIALECRYSEIIALYQPDAIVCEGAFVFKFPAAFAALKLAINLIRRVSYLYLNRDIEEIAPMVTKKIMTRHGHTDKDGIKSSILSCKDLIFSDTVDKENLSEHEYDAIAHGYTGYKTIHTKK